MYRFSSFKILVLGILVLGFFSCIEKSKEKQADTNISEAFNDSVISVLNNKIPAWQSEYNVRCVGLGVIENGKLVFSKVYGDIDEGKIAPQNTIFEVQSITKIIVAVTTLMLVDSGQWDLDEPLFHYWIDPDVKDDPRNQKLTTRIVLGHQTGFANWRSNDPTGKLKFEFEPGTQYQYSGEGLKYLTKALEVKLKMPFEKIVDSVLFKPLEMDDSTLGTINASDAIRLANTYHVDGTPYNNDYNSWEITGAYGLKTTVNDMAKFGIGFLNRDLISDKLYDQMTSPQNINMNYSNGLGCFMVHNLTNNEYVVNHDGRGMGVATNLVLMPESKKGIIVFTTSDEGRVVYNNILRSALKEGAKIAEGLTWERVMPNIIGVSKDKYADYSGIYKNARGDTLNIFEKENGLKMESSDGSVNVVVYPESKERFFPLDYDYMYADFSIQENKIFVKYYDFEDNTILFEGVNIKD